MNCSVESNGKNLNRKGAEVAKERGAGEDAEEERCCSECDYPLADELFEGVTDGLNDFLMVSN